jgi:RNA polymerase sigma-70 factor (ECF subfamily)
MTQNIEIIPTRERELIIRLIDDDEKAFCELYADYKEKLVFFAMQYLKSREYAEDIFQDAFTVIWQSRKFLNPDASFSSFLYTIVKNRVLNQLREIDKFEEIKHEILINAVDYSDDTEKTIVSNDLYSIIQKALLQLTPRQRQIFDLSRTEHLSHKEIANRLGISVNTVQDSISISLKKIRVFLKDNSIQSADMVLLLLILNNFG